MTCARQDRSAATAKAKPDEDAAGGQGFTAIDFRLASLPVDKRDRRLLHHRTAAGKMKQDFLLKRIAARTNGAEIEIGQ